MSSCQKIRPLKEILLPDTEGGIVDRSPFCCLHTSTLLKLYPKIGVQILIRSNSSSVMGTTMGAVLRMTKMRRLSTPQI